MDIDYLIKEYTRFHDNYDGDELRTLRTRMKRLQQDILSGHPNAYEFNERYKEYKKVYNQIIDSYFPFTASTIPIMMDLLYDDKFNNFEPEVYRDVLETFDAMITGKMDKDAVQAKVNHMIKQAIPANRDA